MLKHFDNKNDPRISITAYDRNKELLNYLRNNKKHLYLHKSVKVSNKIIFTDSVNNLLKDSGARENIAIEMINYSIGNGYKGIFKSKSGNNGQSNLQSHQQAIDDIDGSTLSQGYDK